MEKFSKKSYQNVILNVCNMILMFSILVIISKDKKLAIQAIFFNCCVIVLTFIEHFMGNLEIVKYSTKDDKVSYCIATLLSLTYYAWKYEPMIGTFETISNIDAFVIGNGLILFGYCVWKLENNEKLYKNLVFYGISILCYIGFRMVMNPDLSQLKCFTLISLVTLSKNKR